MVQVETLFWSSILNPVQNALISMQAHPHHAHAAVIMDIISGQRSRGEQMRVAEDAQNGLHSGAAVSQLLSAATPIVEAMPG